MRAAGSSSRTGEGEAKRRERGAVQPLHIVDRHAGRPAAASSRAEPRNAAATRSSAGGADSPAGRAASSARRCGGNLDDLAGRRAEQVRQPCRTKPRLRLR